MSFTFYDSVVPTAQAAVRSATEILQKGEKSEKGAELLTARLHPDMLDVAMQVVILFNQVSVLVSKLKGVENVSDSRSRTIEPTYEACYERLRDAAALLEGLDKDAINARQDAVVEVSVKDAKFPMVLKDYTRGWSIPNLIFHVTTTYANLRSQGVPLGKFDYLGEFMLPYYDLKQIKRS